MLKEYVTVHVYIYKKKLDREDIEVSEKNDGRIN